MRSQSVYKIPQGKLLKITLDYDEKNQMINNIWITGDFFAYPEEAIELLEKKLQHTVLEEQSLQQKIHSVITQHHLQFIGLNAEGLTKGILMCKP
jgi:lipoate-protein ligase A